MLKKNSLTKILVAILLFLPVIILSPTSVLSNEQELPKVTLLAEFTYSGVPAQGRSLIAANYQTAFVNIKSGTFSDDITNSIEWINISNDDNTVTTAGYSIGNGIPHSSEEAQTIIRELFVRNFDLLQIINESNATQWGTSPAPGGNEVLPENMQRFHSPGSPEQLVTDLDGRADVEIESGLVAILEGRRVVDLIVVAGESGIIQIDLDATKGFTINITNLDQYRTEENQFTIDYGQEIQYNLEIKADLLSPSETTVVTLRPNSNIVIEDSSIPFERQELVEELILPNFSFDPHASAGALNQSATSIGNSFVNSSIYIYEITLPPSENDITIGIRARLLPQVRIHREIADNSNPYDSVSLDIPINAFTFPNSNFGVSVNLRNNSKNLTILAPVVNTSGINFVQMNAETQVLATGARYVLGRRDGDNLLLYTNQNNWKSISNLSQIDLSNFLMLEGGYSYIIGMNEPMPFPLSQNRFNFDLETNSKVNQSLIRIFGLANRDDFFLYQVRPADGYAATTDPIDFSVFRNYGFRRNNTQITITSINRAVNQSFKINSLIPDHVAGVNEYNILPVTPVKDVPFNAINKIILPLGLIVVAIFIIGGLLIKKV